MADEDEKDNLLEYLGRFVEIMKLLSFVVIDLDKHVTDHVQHMGCSKKGCWSWRGRSNRKKTDNTGKSGTNATAKKSVQKKEMWMR